MVKLFQGAGDSRIHAVFEHAFRGETLAVESDCLLDERLFGQERRKTLAQRRTDERFEMMIRRRIDAQRVEGIPEARQNTLTRIGQGSVEIEKEIHVWPPPPHRAA